MNKVERKKTLLLSSIGKHILGLNIDLESPKKLYIIKIKINQWLRYYLDLLEQNKVLSPSEIQDLIENIDIGLWGLSDLTIAKTPHPMVERLKRHLWLLLEELNQYSETFYHQSIW